MRYHGNYCGPNWSAGKHQPSVVSDVPAIDEFDNTCRIHDAEYARGGDLLRADVEFARANFGAGIKRSAAAAAVGVQAAVRAIDKLIPKVYKNQEKMTKSLRGSGAPPAPKRAQSSTLSTVPASYGYTLRSTPPRITRKGNTATIIGSDFASNVYAVNSANYEPAASVCITPAYFNNAQLGSLSRAYEKFRVNRATLEYIPAVPTSTQGQIVMTSTATVKEPFIPGSSSTFLSRALSQGNAVASPIWKETYIDIPSSTEWSIVDLLLDADLDDSIPQEVQVYTTCDSTVVSGILILHYEIEFCDPLYTYHSALFPVPKGNGVQVSFVDEGAANAVNDAIGLTNASVAFTEGTGTVYRMIFQQARSTLPVGPASWAAVAKNTVKSAVTSSTQTHAYTNLTCVTGTVFYGVLTASNVTLYATYEEAAAGSLNVVVYQTATTATGTWYFLVEQVRIAPSDRVTTQ